MYNPGEKELPSPSLHKSSNPENRIYKRRPVRYRYRTPLFDSLLTISCTIFQAKYSFLREAGYGGKFDTIHRADLRVSDISNLLGGDWVRLGRELGVEEQDINLIITEYPDNVGQQAMVMLRSDTEREKDF